MMSVDYQSSCSLTCPTLRLSKQAARWMITRSEMFWGSPRCTRKSPQSGRRWFSAGGSLILSRQLPQLSQLVSSPQRIAEDCSCGERETEEKRPSRSEEHTSELQSLRHLVCRL